MGSNSFCKEQKLTLYSVSLLIKDPSDHLTLMLAQVLRLLSSQTLISPGDSGYRYWVPQFLDSLRELTQKKKKNVNSRPKSKIKGWNEKLINPEIFCSPNRICSPSKCASYM
jgi:hypothetical protein